MEIVERRLTRTVMSLLEECPAVVILGARQVGKSTLSRAIAQKRECVFYDLEDDYHRDQLSYRANKRLTSHKGKLVVLDEVQHLPNLFKSLRVAIDQLRREDLPAGNFLLMGSAQGELLRQRGETLAGRVAFTQLRGFDWLELAGRGDIKMLWERGGYPDSYLAATDQASRDWRRRHLRVAITSDLRECGVDATPDLVNSVLMAIAEGQGNPLKTSALSGALGITKRTLKKYLALLERLMIIRTLEAHVRTDNLRLRRSSKVYLCDSGLFHILRKFDFSLPRQPVHDMLLGASWEGFVIENLISVMPWDWTAKYFRDYNGNEVDLVLEHPDGKLWAIEIKSGNARPPKPQLRKALAAVQPERAFQVCGGTAREGMDPFVESLTVKDMMAELLRQNKGAYASDDVLAGQEVAREAMPARVAEPFAEATAAQADHRSVEQLSVYSDEGPLKGADVLAVMPDKTWDRASTDAQGTVRLALRSEKQPVTVFAACAGFAAVTASAWIPRDRKLVMILPALPAGGSLVLPDSHGEVPGLQGTISPAQDRAGTLWMLAEGITIGDGVSRPVRFEVGEDMAMRDQQGNTAQVRVVSIVGRASLIEYRSR